MDTDRNLLFGVLALETDLIHNAQFVEICTLWTTRKHVPIADLLVEKGWITAEDRAAIQHLLERKVARSGGDARSSLASVPDPIRRSLAGLDDIDIRLSLADHPSHDPAEHTTHDAVPGPGERYTLCRVHASGGIGRVWLARDNHLDRDVALKELRPERLQHPIFSARFLREARITGQLEHPGIVPVYELSRRTDTEQPFYTMRFIKGRTLSAAARAYHEQRAAGAEGPLELLPLLNAFVMVCRTVAYAHSRGVVHRDLKGENVILGDFGEVLVVDWGLAKLLQPAGAAAETMMGLPAGLDDVQPPGLTGHGQALGTPAYMAPEQAAGRLELIDQRTDVYGLGAILYEALTGQPPFAGADTNEVLWKVQYQDPAAPRKHWPEVPPLLEAACLRALAKRPADRFASAGELALEVERWQEVQRRQAEEVLRQKTALLQLLQGVAAAANAASTIRDALQVVLDQVCLHTGWPVGHAFLRGEGAEPGLVPSTIWHLADAELYAPFRRITETTPLPNGRCLPGRILASGKPAWIMDVTLDDNFPRGRAAGAVGIKAAFGFPVRTGDEVAAVLEFFSPEAQEPDEALLEVMSHVGTQLGHVVERQRSSGRLRRQQEALTALTRGDVLRGAETAAVLRHMTEVAARTLGVERVSVWHYTPDEAAITCLDLYELSKRQHAAGAVLQARDYPHYFQALSTSEVVAADDARADARTWEFRDGYLVPLGITSMLDVPIYLFGRLAGVLCHEQVGAPRRWTADEQLFALAVSNLMSLAQEQAERRRAEEALRRERERGGARSGADEV